MNLEPRECNVAKFEGHPSALAPLTLALDPLAPANPAGARKRASILACVALTLACLALQVRLLLALMPTPAPPKLEPAPAPSISTFTVTLQPEEDEPGWDCRTMGNLDCGPNPRLR